MARTGFSTGATHRFKAVFETALNAERF